MNDDRDWQRIQEAVGVLAKEHSIEIPTALIVVSGSVWERNRQKREALNVFLGQIPNGVQFSEDDSLTAIADVLDLMALGEQEQELEEE